ncbi:ComEC/Rec2 family competence protein [Desulfitobacterium sp. PCE1]|uniref:ComEC/Rec2 family competence protein n=1 Tax=Desulfitobacterium sp. PCE1 TaxID=146907 RepID=UPI00036DB569|nr:ComEC/Rec2 family competence protein [Desulfitobacterium sp. PCE1]
MKGYKIGSFLLVILLAIALVGCAGLTNPNPQDSQDKKNNLKEEQNIGSPLKVSFIDVGQADAALIQIPNGKNIVIDAGKNNDGEFLIKYLEDQGIKEIHILIGTHPHEDHIGGMDKVIENFKIGQVIMPKVTHNTRTFEDVLLAVQEKGLKIKEGKAGVQLDLGLPVEGLPPVSAEILAPMSGKYEDLNNYSIVLRLVYGANAFLFTGDAEDVSEKEMLASGVNLKADVLKVGHHGSSSSTTKDFLTAVDPKHAIISVGKDNSYGHPTEKVLKRLREKGAVIYRTDQAGTITVTSDGSTLTFALTNP